MAIEKGSQIKARADSDVNVLNAPVNTGTVVAKFEKGGIVGYATGEVFVSTRQDDPTEFYEILYVAGNSILNVVAYIPFSIGYVDKDSVDVLAPVSTSEEDIKVVDEKGNELPSTQSDSGILLRDKDGKLVVVVPSSGAGTTTTAFPEWAKWVIIGVAGLLAIVAGVWIYKQFKKPKKS